MSDKTKKAPLTAEQKIAILSHAKTNAADCYGIEADSFAARMEALLTRNHEDDWRTLEGVSHIQDKCFDDMVLPDMRKLRAPREITEDIRAYGRMQAAAKQR